MADRKKQVNLRISEQDRALFDEAADYRDETLTQFLVESGRERAQRLLADRNTFVLDEEQWQEFTEMLDRPPRVNPGLVDLFSRPRPE
jgi:uncharacterized protein (DUF1778 family)